MRKATAAYHEAGHAVAAHYQGVSVSRVTIVGTKATNGSCSHTNLLRNWHVDADAGTANRWRMERLVIVALAGVEAQRRHNPRSIRTHHGAADWEQAVDLVSYFVSSREETEAYLRLLSIRAGAMFEVPAIWEDVKAVAHALLAEQTVSSRRLRTIILRT